MPAYDGILFDPPAPVAIVSVRSPSSGQQADDVVMLIDSGADATVLPASLAERLPLAEEGGSLYELLGFNNSVSFSPAVTADLVTLGKTFSGRFLLTPNSWGVLGRN